MKHRSYTERLIARRRARRTVALLVAAFFAASLAHGCFLQTMSVDSEAMAPAIEPGDRILASPAPFGPRLAAGKLPALRSPRRGELVVTDLAEYAGIGFTERLLDSTLRFLSLQRFSWLERRYEGMEGSRSVRRVIGLPGDTVRMESWILYVRPRGESRFRTEFDFVRERYALRTQAVPELWRADMPGSGFMAETTVPEGSYFLAGDNRGASADSTVRGTYRAQEIAADVLLRFWPPSRFGAP